jgi:hypothetical protein
MWRTKVRVTRTLQRLILTSVQHEIEELLIERMHRGDGGDGDGTGSGRVQQQWPEALQGGDGTVIVDRDGGGAGDVDSGHGKYGVDDTTTAVCDLFDHRGAPIDRAQISDDVGVANVHPDDLVAL